MLRTCSHPQTPTPHRVALSSSLILFLTCTLCGQPYCSACCRACRPSGATRAAADGAYQDLVRKTVQIRRTHDSFRLRYHQLMHAATRQEAALLHSHNDSIRFLSWLLALVKVRASCTEHGAVA